MTSIVIDDKDLGDALSRIVEAAGDPQSALQEIGRYGEKSTRDRFHEGVEPGGLPWLPSIRVQKQGGKTLQESRRLLDSFTFNVGPDFVEWGTNVHYAGVHQFGATIRPVNAKELRFQIPGVGWIRSKEVTIPARPFIGIDEHDKEEIGGILVHWLEEATAKGS